MNIPGREQLTINHVVLDYNGTMAVDGHLLPGVAEKLNELSALLTIHILTADTFGKVRSECHNINGIITVLPPGAGAEAKRQYITRLGRHEVAAIGNGYNDHLMLESAALGILVMEEEGVSVRSLQNADVVVKSIHHALDLLLKPQRLIATLRN
ncbi:MAG: HAD family hydrolase [Bacillota bacterium]|uniref:HAD family hydrolase n=1 Tax=Desulfurispora thermophila TaxID=265470 RepID=UPI001FA7C0AB|nr:ATPase P [Desulfurispora thermophila]